MRIRFETVDVSNQPDLAECPECGADLVDLTDLVADLAAIGDAAHTPEDLAGRAVCRAVLAQANWLASVGDDSVAGHSQPRTTESSPQTRPHVNADGEFQSDKYPTCPPGKVPLSVEDSTAQDLLWEYAQRRRSVDASFSDDLEHCLRAAGYKP